MRYDAAIIGAGADGLAAALHLARAGRKVVVVERADRAGGRLQTREFHPGFSASPFLDSVPEIPASLLANSDIALCAAGPVSDGVRQRLDAVVARVLAAAAAPHRSSLLAALGRRSAPPATPWPGSDLATARLADWPEEAQAALTGRALDADLAGSALALLTLPRVEAVAGGLGALGAAFAAAAQAADVELRLGLEASEVTLVHTRFGGRRVSGVLLADASRIEAATVISTLDYKQSLLSLFPWRVLPPELVAGAGAFRMAGSRARLLLALKAPVAETPLFLAGDDKARAVFRQSGIPDNPPLRFDPVSTRDAGLAPPGGAVATVTLGCIPYRLFDGGWSHQKRLSLSGRTLKRLNEHLPGLLEALVSVEIIVPPDIEAALGVTAGDLDGGQLAPDQMLGLRPDIRTVVPGFYLGGASTGAGPLGTGLAGLAAAMAVLADGGTAMTRAISGKAIVIGASAAGLAAAAYLARGGREVLLLEAGAAPAEPVGLLAALDPQMIADLKLIKHGLRFKQRDLPLTALGDVSLTLGRDAHGAARAIAILSSADAKAYSVFRRDLFRQARRLRRFWWSGLTDGAPHWMLDGKKAKEAFDRLCLTGADAWLGARFESDALIGALLADAVAGGLAPSEPGSALALFWRASGEMAGLQGAGALAEPGSLIAALLRSLTAAGGGRPRAYARVARILVDHGAVKGVELEDGEKLEAPLVLSALSRDATDRLLGLVPSGPRSGDARLLLSLSEPVRLAPARYRIADRAEIFVAAQEEARAGRLPAELPLEFVPLDPNHLVVTIRPLPLLPPVGWRAQLAAQAVVAIGRHVPGLARNLSDVEFKLSVRRASLAQLLAPAAARLRTGTQGLYLCGADAEPMTALSGRAARIAAGFALEPPKD